MYLLAYDFIFLIINSPSELVFLIPLENQNTICVIDSIDIDLENRVEPRW